MNNKMIGKCKQCSQAYCLDCSEHGHWRNFCSDDCYDEWRKYIEGGGRMKSDYELPEGDKQIGNLTVSELKALIKECIRELNEEKQFSENNYKAMWIKHGAQILIPTM